MPRFLYGATCRCLWCGAPVQLGRFDTLAARPGVIGMLHSEPNCDQHAEFLREVMAGGSATWGELMRGALQPFTAAERAQVRAMRAWSKPRIPRP